MGRFYEVTAKAFSVLWWPPTDNGPIDRYRVEAASQDNPLAEVVGCRYTSGEDARCESLQGNTHYKVTIEAWCAQYETAPADYGAALITTQQLTGIDSKSFFLRYVNTINEWFHTNYLASFRSN